MASRIALESGQQAVREVTPDRLSGRVVDHEVAIVLDPEVRTGMASRARRPSRGACRIVDDKIPVRLHDRLAGDGATRICSPEDCSCQHVGQYKVTVALIDKTVMVVG